MKLTLNQMQGSILSLFLAAQLSSVSPFLFPQQSQQASVASRGTRFHSSVSDINDGTATDDPSFSQLGIHPSVLNAIWSRPEWEQPTPVQQLAIPRLLKRGTTDAFWCEAPTGSGKTAAYLIPLLQNILVGRNQKQKGERVTSLVLCPTRELCVQIGEVLDQMVDDIVSMDRRSNFEISTMVLHGGVPLEPQIARLADCVRYHTSIDILVATPGRLIDVLTSYGEDRGNASAKDAALERRLLAAIDDTDDGEISWEELQRLGLDKPEDARRNDDGSDGRSQLVNSLKGLRYLVFDESDRLLGNGFKTEVDSVLDLLSPSSTPSTWLFSATFPKSIEPRLDSVLSSIGATKSPIRLVCANSDRKLSEDIPVSSSLKKKLQKSNTVASASNYQQVGPASTIRLRTIRMEKTARTQVLRKLLETHQSEWDRVVVFVSTRYASEHVSRKLRRYGISSSELHGKLDQDARLRRLNDLKKGKIRVLLCTDVASRGIDISGLPAVVNYDLPRSTSDFVHRIGRTGRAGQEGVAVSFVTASTAAHMDLIETRHLESPPDREVLPGFEPNEERWNVESEGARISIPGTKHSSKGIEHDKMVGGTHSMNDQFAHFCCL
jgi:superfamily II DNA/RNA helicase